MAKRELLTAFVIASLASCSSPEAPQDDEADEAEFADLDGRPIPEIEGNETANLIARGDRLERAIALADVVKGITGKKRCSAKKTLYRGEHQGAAFWSIECHDGESFQIRAKPDGSGDVLKCALLDSIGVDGDCWTPFPESKEVKR